MEEGEDGTEVYNDERRVATRNEFHAKISGLPFGNERVRATGRQSGGQRSMRTMFRVWVTVIVNVFRYGMFMESTNKELRVDIFY